jgi:hypothetical protein
MIYTFLPRSEQKDIKRDYRIRVAIVLLFFLSLAAVVGVGSLFPAYIHASLEENLRLRDAAALKKTSAAAGLAVAERTLSDSTTLMSLLSRSVSSGQFSAAIADIAYARGGVKVTSFSVVMEASSTLSIIIGGFAPTRVSLLSFKNRLDALAPGISVDLPVSELARDANIQFSIKIIEPMP